MDVISGSPAAAAAATSATSDYTSVLAQKAIQQITEPAAISNLTPLVTGEQPAPPPNPVNFVQEIQSMLYAFGDSRRPKLETAILVDDIVRQQLVEILRRAVEASHLRGAGGLVGIEDVVFLLRKNPVRVQRFFKYFSVKDVVVLVGGGAAAAAAAAEKRRARRCRDFLLSIDAEGGLLHQALQDEIHDQVRTNRLKRLDRFSRNLEERKYAEFTRARQVSFLGHNIRFSAKFGEWVLTGIKATATDDSGSASASPADLSAARMDQSGLEALAYLAYETVGYIVDMALLVRHDQDANCKSDHVMRTISPVSYNTQYPMVQMPQLNDGCGGGGAEANSSSKGGGAGKDEDYLPWTQPLEPHHILEAVRRLTQRPNTFLGWYGRPEKRNQSHPMPLIAI